MRTICVFLIYIFWFRYIIHPFFGKFKSFFKTAECLIKINSFDKKNIESKTKDHQGLTLNIAFNYGSKDEIVNAFKKMANDKVLFTKENVDKYLYTSESKDVDLLIRTSGEQRISNYLLWQIAYAEIYFTDVYWPDFNINELEKALDSFQNRKRRFGGLDNEK